MRIVVLGGSGMMGCISVQDLARSAGVSEVVIAARNMDKAQEVADYIGSSKVSLAQVDVRDHEALVNLLRQPYRYGG